MAKCGYSRPEGVPEGRPGAGPRMSRRTRARGCCRRAAAGAHGAGARPPAAPMRPPHADAGPTPTPTSTSTDAVGPGAGGIGDSYYPQAGNGGYDVGNYDLDVTTNLPRSSSPASRPSPPPPRHLTQLRPGLHRSEDGLGHGRRHGGRASTLRRRQAGGDPDQPIPTGTAFTTVVRYGGQPQGFNDPQLGGEVSSPPPTAPSRSASRSRGELVPGQRPPARQGDLHIKITAPVGVGRALQRRAAVQVDRARLDDVDLAGVLADGVATWPRW